MEEQSEFRDELIKPSDIKNIWFYHFRKSGIGKMLDYIKIELPDGKFIQLFDTVSKTQLISRVGLKISNLRSIYDYNERNQALLEACKKRSEPLLFRLVKSNGYWNCYAVTTEKFTEVKHHELYQIVQNELKSRNLVWTKEESFRTRTRVWKTYLFERNIGAEVGENIQCGIRCCNSVKATSSIIFFGFWVRLVCENGMTATKGHWSQRTVHRGEKSDILSTVKHTLDDVLSEVFGFEQQIDKAIHITLTPEQKEQVLDAVGKRKHLPQWVQKEIHERLKHEQGNLWGLSQAFTYFSSHNSLSDDQRISIEQTAHWLMILDRGKLVELVAQEIGSDLDGKQAEANA